MARGSTRERISKTLQSKTTDELLAVWKANKRTAWSDEAFEVMADILAARSVELPPQDSPTSFDLTAAPPPVKDVKMPVWLMAILIAVPAVIILFLSIALFRKLAEGLL
ncbi:MAG: hypothetical protein GY868_02320 [Deltaproteobacteria bacterium]|nr:hypothetical protein [Deltaproteobacteria bacterium]